MWRFRCVGLLRLNSPALWNRQVWLTVEAVAAANGPHEQPIRNEEHLHGNA